MAEHFVDLIIQHEGLEEYQTPFRITSPEMAQWKTIHGKKISVNAKKSKGREKFIYLENKEDIPVAVRRQFINYSKTPQKYGIKPVNPTIEEGVRVFDQTGAEGKIKFLKSKGIDTKAKLKDVLSNDEPKEKLVEKLSKRSIDMPAQSKKQRRMFAIAEHAPEMLYERNKGATAMPKKEMRTMAMTKEEGLPLRKRMAKRKSK